VKLSGLLTLLVIFHFVVIAGASDKLPVFTDVTKEAGILVKNSYGDSELTNIVEGTGSGAMLPTSSREPAPERCSSTTTPTGGSISIFPVLAG